jgi:hypothetical protein
VVITHDGQVVHQGVAELLGAPGPHAAGPQSEEGADVDGTTD